MTVCPSIGRSVGLLIFGIFKVLQSTAWPVLALVDFENDAHARLHDEAMAELAKYLERKAAENKVKAEERRQALEARKTSSCS